MPLPDRVESWVAAGIISDEQADRILAAERAGGPSAEPRRASLVTEALGYVGGALVVVAAVALSDRYWAVLGTGGRLAVAFGASAALLGVGLAVPAVAGTPAARMRAVTWLTSVVTFALGVSLLVEPPALPAADVAAVVTGGATTAYAGFLWWRNRGVLQHAAFVVGLAATAGTAAALLPQGDEAVPALALWGVGAAWLVLGQGRTVAQRPATVLGGLAVVLGGRMAADGTDWGGVLALVTAAVLVTVGVLGRDLVALGAGSVAVLVGVPTAVQRWFPDALGAPLALLVAGLLLVVATFVTMRRRRERPERGSTAVAPALVPALAAVVALAVAVTVAVLGT
jgi:hypothetical protein